MEGEDYDDISNIKFKEVITRDKELQASNERLIMKYFGSKLKKNPEEKVEKYESPKKLAVFRPILVSSAITLLIFFSNSSLVTNFFNFTTKPVVNQIIFYGVLFLLIFSLLTISN
jgi:ascorbate-specific PTS system EIIC-type component UlaA